MSDRLADITAVILAGGMGTRLRPIISDRQKVVAEVFGKPFITYLMDHLIEAGIRRVVLCTGYQSEEVREKLGDSYKDLALAYSEESIPLGTGGALRQALPLCSSSVLLVMNGDSFCEVDLAEFYDYHDGMKVMGSLVVSQASDTSRYGKVEIDSDGRITSFVEKSSSSGPGWINAGIYLLNSELITEIDAAGSSSLEQTMFPQWIERRLAGYPSTGRFLDIGTPESFTEATSFFASALD